MEHLIRRRMVEEEVKDDNNAGKDGVEIIGPPPPLSSVENKAPGDDRAEDGERNRRHQDHAIGHSSVFVGYQLSDDDGEGELDGGGEPGQAAGSDQGGDVLCRRSHDATNEAEDISSDEEPATAEDVRQSPHEGVA